MSPSRTATRQGRPRSGVSAGAFLALGVGMLATHATARSLPSPVREIASSGLPMLVGIVFFVVAALMLVLVIIDRIRLDTQTRRIEAEAQPPSGEAEERNSQRTWQDLGPGGRIMVATMAGCAAASAAFLMALGFVGSFETQKKVAQPAMHAWAWSVPVIADVGSVLLILVDFLLAFFNVRIPVLRLVTLGWLSGTVGLNLAAGHGDFKQMAAHALYPGIIILYSEICRFLLSHWARQISPHAGDTFERIPMMWWILRPWPTFVLWRRRVLLQITTIKELRDANARFMLAKAQARKKYASTRLGKVFWRLQTPKHVVLAIMEDRLDNRGFDLIADAARHDLFGDMLEELRASGSLPSSRRRRQYRPRPDNTAGPHDESVKEDTAPPPNPEDPREMPPARWREPIQQGYWAYERHLLEKGVEMTGAEVQKVIGQRSPGNARNVRNSKFRDLFVRRHPDFMQKHPNIFEPDAETSGAQPEGSDVPAETPSARTDDGMFKELEGALAGGEQ